MRSGNPCKRGHPATPENRWANTPGCRACARERYPSERERRAAIREGRLSKDRVAACHVCGHQFTKSNMGRNRRYCGVKCKRKASEANHRWAQIKSRYGVGKDGFASILLDQNGKCAICALTLVLNAGNGGAAPHLDHDHSTGVARGILCKKCNIGLGNFRDDPKLLISALEYLAKHRAAAETAA